MLNQRTRYHLNDDVVDADLQIRVQRIDAMPHFNGTIHFDFAR
jgi:hypothetical protein